MDGLRTLTADEAIAPTYCDRCRATGCLWDRIGGVAICPDCQETLIRGEGDPISLHLDPRHCAACASSGTIPFVTVPLQSKALVMDLCPTHLRALLGRCLEPAAFLEIARQLQAAALAPGRIFLLHEAFYNRQGRALQPIREAA